MRITVKYLTRVVALSGLAALLLGETGCQSTPDRSAGEVRADKSQAKAVKKALDKAPIFKFPDISATAYQGTVQLTGFVETEEQRLQAAQIAANVKGVDQVINQVMIKPTPAGRATIRDPLGHDTGRLLLDTNAPPPDPMHMYPFITPQPSPSKPEPSPSKP